VTAVTNAAGTPAGSSAAWRPSVAYFRSAVGAVVLITVALVVRRPDLLVIATPMVVVTVWSLLTRPTARPAFEEHLGHTTIREGEATTWHGGWAAVRDLDIAVASIQPSPWMDTRPSSGVVTVGAVDGAASLAIVLRSTRWGRRPLETIAVVGHSPWAGFRWSTSAGPHHLTTLPRPALFDTDAFARPSDGLVGQHRSARAGEGNEFAGIRPFRAGDRMRRINWPRSIRAGELRVNSTWADLDSHVALLIDATDDFGVSEGIDGRASSLDGAVRAAGAIAEYYAPRGDRVSLRTFGSATIESVRAGTGRVQLRRILEALARLTPGNSSLMMSRRSRGRTMLRFDAQLVVMLSPLIAPDALDAAVELARQGVAVIIVDTLPDHVTQDDDQYVALAWRIRLLERRRELRMVVAAGIPVVEWRGPGSLDQVIRDISRRTSAPRMLPR
jgi:uncharacterized protein (DUF58 family)